MSDKATPTARTTTCFAVFWHLRERGYRFYFCSSDKDEPPHVHVEREAKKAKFWLDPIVAGPSSGFNRAQLTEIYRLIATHQELLLKGWHDFFGP